MNTATMSSVLGDKETVNDLIATQKYASSNYNTYAGECVCEKLRNDFLNMLREEHEIQNELFTIANDRGWYPVKQAQPADITQVLSKFPH